MRSLLLGFGLALVAAPALAAEPPKQPPPCSKLEFRPVAPGAQSEGDAEAGMYRSRFIRLEVKAAMKGGEPQDYFVVANGKKLEPLAGQLPPHAAECASEKKVPAPAQAASAACTGDRFAVVLSNKGEQKLALLYARKGKQWSFCRAGMVPPRSAA
jgi:hypothetical protein